jgi:hypothetical protein
MAKASQVEQQARALCGELGRATGRRMWHWRTLAPIADALGLDQDTGDAAIAYAISRGWLIGEGKPPHSICLTDEGRILTGRRRPRARS